MKVLVTGGAGFIGSNLVDRLIELEYEVVVVDNLSTGFRKNVNPKAKFYELDICQEKLAEIFEREKPDVVSHQAAQTAIQKSVITPILDARENILGSINVILSCLRFGVRKIVYASSGGAVYGEPERLPVSETHSANPVSQYGVSKHAVEHYLYVYGKSEGLNYVILRYPNVYGPRQNPNGEAGVVAIFTTKMLKGERPVIFGPGDKTRDYTFVKDIVEGNILAIDKGEKEAYNIGTGIEISDQEIFDAVARATNYEGTPVYSQVRKGEVYRVSLDSTKAWKELQWKPKYSLEQGINETVDYFKSSMKSDKGGI